MTISEFPIVILVNGQR